MAAEAADLISDALLPGSTYVDALPFLRFLPAWFPGVQFQGKASRSRELTHKLVQETFDLVKENLVCFCRKQYYSTKTPFAVAQ